MTEPLSHLVKIMLRIREVFNVTISLLMNTKIGNWDLEKYGFDNVNIDPSDVKPLSRISKGSQGYLKKFNVYYGDTLLFIKAGEVSGIDYNVLQPITERIVSEIGRLLGFDCVPYECWVIDKNLFDILDQDDYSGHSDYERTPSPSPIVRNVSRPTVSDGSFEGTLAFNGKALVSCSASFIPDHLIFKSADEYLSDVRESKLHEKICSYGPHFKKSVDQMILFDFLFNNIDRHRKNFGFLVDHDGQLHSFAPLYDHGHCLLSNFRYEELERKKLDVLDHCVGASFRRNLLDDFSTLVDPKSLEGIDFNIEEDQLADIVEKYRGLISNLRINLMQELLRRRWKYVKRKVLPEV